MDRCNDQTASKEKTQTLPGWSCESWTQADRFDHNGFCKGL